MTARARKDADPAEDERDTTVTAHDADADADTKAEGGTRQAKRDADGDGKADGTKYLNVSTSVIRYDKPGHTVGPGEWTPALNLDAIGRAARTAGHLLPPSKVD